MNKRLNTKKLTGKLIVGTGSEVKFLGSGINVEYCATIISERSLEETDELISVAKAVVNVGLFEEDYGSIRQENIDHGISRYYKRKDGSNKCLRVNINKCWDKSTKEYLPGEIGISIRDVTNDAKPKPF